MAIFKGLSAFPITPADAKGHVDIAGVNKFVQRLVDAQVDSIGLLGSTGTYAYLTRAERQRTIVAAAAIAGGKTPLIVGVGTLRTDDCVALAKDAQNAGANGVLLAPVSYTPLFADEVYEHYMTVADATELPLCIYNNPSTTGFLFDVDLLARLANHANIVAVKMPMPTDGIAATSLAAVQAAVGDNLQIGFSGDWGCPDAMLSGAAAWYSVVGGLLPVQTLALARAAQSGDRTTVDTLRQAFQPLFALFKEFGGLRVVYTAVQIMGLTKCTPPRPILPLSDVDKQRVTDALMHLSVDC